MTVQSPPSPTKYKLTVADFQVLHEAGAFGDARTELVDGDVIVTSPQYRPHGFLKSELGYRLRRALEMLGSGLYVAMEQSVDLDPHSEPMPDIILTSEPIGSGAIPIGSVALLLEVADASLTQDLVRKAPLYAAAGLPEYWVADVNGHLVHRMWIPTDGAYTEADRIELGQPLRSATIAGLVISTEGL